MVGVVALETGEWSCEGVLWYEGGLVNNGRWGLSTVVVGGEGIGEEPQDVKAVPSLSFFIGLEV